MRNLRQIKDLINNIAKKKDINAQILLRNYQREYNYVEDGSIYEQAL